MRAALALLGLCVAVSALAQERKKGEEQFFPQQMTAKELLYACTSSALTRVGRERRKYCHGFVSGAEEAARLVATQSSAGDTQSYCLPQGKTAGYFAQVFVKYASRTSADLNKPAVLVVIQALEESFTCQQ